MTSTIVAIMSAGSMRPVGLSISPATISRTTPTRKVYLIVEPAKGILRHRLIEAREVGPGIYGLHLDSEGLELRLHRFGDSLDRMLGRRVGGKSGRAQESSDRGKETICRPSSHAPNALPPVE